MGLVYISPIGKIVDIPEPYYTKLVVFKIFWPETYEVEFGAGKKFHMKDIVVDKIFLTERAKLDKIHQPSLFDDNTLKES